MSSSTRTAALSVTLTAVAYDHPNVRTLLAALHAEQLGLYATADHPDDLPADVFAPPHGRFLLARTATGDPAGCGGWHGHDHTGATAEIKRMYVTPDHRGRGIARAMLTALEHDARTRGARRLILETGVRNASAIALYTAGGFAPTASYVPGRDPEINRAFAKDLTTTP